MPPWTVKRGVAAAVGKKVNGEEGKASATARKRLGLEGEEGWALPCPCDANDN